MAQMAQSGTESCNTESRTRNWFGTWNNYPIDGTAQLLKYIGNNEYVIGEEVGEGGTPHLQFCFKSKNPIRFGGIKKDFPQVHWEVVKNWKKSVIYCKKEGRYICNPPEKEEIRDPLEGKTLRPFQQEIVNIIETEPDDRTIHWYWEPEGNVGKTVLAKHICLKYKNALFLSGKANDIKCGVADFVKKGNTLKTAIFYFPRTIEEYVSYEAIESIKDGIFYSGKYESGMVMYNPPHVICMANFEPDTRKLSKDRWSIKHVPPGESP